VQMLRPGVCKTFEDYRQKIFIPHLLSLIKKVYRLDLVFDVYHTNSLKQMTREKRGTGTKTLVGANTRMPTNWQEFLRVDENKTALFHFLANISLADYPEAEGKTVIVTYDDQVRFIVGHVDTDDIHPCSHEEADTRVILHCWHAGQFNCPRVAIRTVDTDVVVLAIAFVSKMNLQEVWIHFGVGKNARLIPVHELLAALGLKKSLALPMFHAFTGCDTVSCFMARVRRLHEL
jgi:hypothetical protein